MPDISTDYNPTIRTSLVVYLDTIQASVLYSLPQSAIARLLEQTCDLTTLNDHFDITQIVFVILYLLAAIQILPYACVVFVSSNRGSIIYLDCG